VIAGYKMPRNLFIFMEQKNELRVQFSKTGDMRFISHLDLMRLFQRAARRTGLGVLFTQGFSPRLKMSVARALKLGLESREEEAVFYADIRTSADEFLRRMNEQLPEGVRILQCHGKYS